jgi:HEAT repeat protein
MKLMFIAVSLAATLAARPSHALGAEKGFASMPRPAWADADPADSLYRSARRALTEKNYEVAARTFDAIVTRFPRSEYAPDALYWKGFALYRNGSLDDAAAALEAQAKRYPQATTRSDAAALLIQIKGQLARRGDASAQADVNRAANQSVRGCDDMEVQMAALDALQQMDADRAVPLLRRVLARRDVCSKTLRKNALFILAQRSGGDREQILLDVAKNDPDPEVRKDAVFHLQQATSDGADAALEDLLLRSEERGVRQNALFALAQHRSDRARNILRAFVLSEKEPVALRKDAIFHLAQSREPADQIWLRDAYSKLSNAQLRSDLMFQIAQSPGAEASRWLASVVADTREPEELRKNALFHLAQRDDPGSLDRLITVAKSSPTPALRKEALFHIGQSKDPRALKALEEIVNP